MIIWNETPTKLPARHRVTSELPPGGGACWWCSGTLARRDGRWTFAEIVDSGHPRAVHVGQCAGPGAETRPRKLRFVWID